MKYLVKSQKKNTGWILPIVLLAVAVLITGSVWGIHAKYAHETQHDAAVVAKEFYFSSDRLMDSGKTYELNPDTTQISFYLRDYDDALRKSEEPVSYTVYCQVEGESETTTVAQGVIDQDTATKIDLPVVSGKTYRITAVGEAGYKKTLSATFIVKTPNQKAYKQLDTRNSAYVVLTVWTMETTGTVSITFPDGLIPDASDDALAGIVNYSESGYTGKTFTREFTDYYQSENYRFFKEDPTANYTLNQFPVTIDGKTVNAFTVSVDENAGGTETP